MAERIQMHFTQRMDTVDVTQFAFGKIIVEDFEFSSI